jgi:hypothetical protein
MCISSAATGKCRDCDPQTAGDQNGRDLFATVDRGGTLTFVVRCWAEGSTPTGQRLMRRTAKACFLPFPGANSSPKANGVRRWRPSFSIPPSQGTNLRIQIGDDGAGGSRKHRTEQRASQSRVIHFVLLILIAGRLHEPSCSLWISRHGMRITRLASPRWRKSKGESKTPAVDEEVELHVETVSLPALATALGTKRHSAP